MTEPKDRLRQARIDAGFRSAKEAAERHEWNLNTYTAHENGNRNIPFARAKVYARAYGVSPFWILTGDGGSKRNNEIPLVGLVGAGQEVFPLDDHAKGSGLDYVEAPPGASPGSAGLRVKGDIMEPVYRDGDVLIYSRRSDDPASLIGRDRVVWLSDGRVMVKDLMPGSNNRFTLHSHNSTPLYDQEVVYAARIEWVKRRP